MALFIQPYKIKQNKNKIVTVAKKNRDEKKVEKLIELFLEESKNRRNPKNKKKN